MNLREKWKDIKEYEGLYQISNLGRVKNLKRKRILLPRQYGYHHSPIIRCCNNKRKTAYRYIWQYEI